MAEFTLKYADARGQVHQISAVARNEAEVRERFTRDGFLVYSVTAKNGGAAPGARGKGVDMEKFLILNQQFVTLIKAGLPILKALDLLAERLTDDKLRGPLTAVRDEVRTGALLSTAFQSQRMFPPMYITTIMAGERAGSLAEVMDRYINYQKLALSVRKKLITSLIYPALLFSMVLALIVFLITFVVPKFSELYSSLNAELPMATKILVSVSTTASSYILFGFLGLVGLVAGIYFWSRTERAQETIDLVTMRFPLFGEIWTKFQVAQLARVLSTLLVGGIPLLQAIHTAGESVSSVLIRKALAQASQLVREGQPLSHSLKKTGIFPDLAVDMMEVGESTGALPTMLGSVAEFYEEDVQNKLAAVLSLIEPVIMIFMGTFVAFVLIALYLPIFSLADSLS
ncbi:type II secretion system F family protein [Bryobacter aggregatus]|uniref:type II secretion system F family protein n=1 Tax=Bryobacter aggregatus TaxID=360054 RepID=UPI0004E0C940|nr:type II secretion system F family protein [Bryobacter aggregatus]